VTDLVYHWLRVGDVSGINEVERLNAEGQYFNMCIVMRSMGLWLQGVDV